MRSCHFGIAACAVMVCLLTVPAHAQFFRDVPETDRDARAITDTAYHQLMEGFPDGTFRAEAPMRRVDSLLVLARLVNVTRRGFMALPRPAQPEPAIPQPWCAPAATFLAAQGMLPAYATPPTKLGTPVTRAEFVEALAPLVQVEPLGTASLAGMIRLFLVPETWQARADTSVTRREAARVLDEMLVFLTQHAVTEGTITRLEMDAQQLRWAVLATPIGEARLCLPQHGVLVHGGEADDLCVDARIRTVSDAVAGTSQGTYYRVREVTLLASAPAP